MSERVHMWPAYLVSAPHRERVATRAGIVDVPYGTWHARLAGSLQTACGLPAVTWTYFWTLALDEGGDRVCRECVDAVRTAPG